MYYHEIEFTYEDDDGYYECYVEVCVHNELPHTWRGEFYPSVVDEDSSNGGVTAFRVDQDGGEREVQIEIPEVVIIETIDKWRASASGGVFLLPEERERTRDDLI